MAWEMGEFGFHVTVATIVPKFSGVILKVGEEL